MAGPTPAAIVSIKFCGSVTLSLLALSYQPSGMTVPLQTVPVIHQIERGFHLALTVGPSSSTSRDASRLPASFTAASCMGRGCFMSGNNAVKLCFFSSALQPLHPRSSSARRTKPGVRRPSSQRCGVRISMSNSNGARIGRMASAISTARCTREAVSATTNKSRSLPSCVGTEQDDKLRGGDLHDATDGPMQLTLNLRRQPQANRAHGEVSLLPHSMPLGGGQA